MRVLLVTPSAPDRLHALMPLAWALRTAGHETQIAGRPGFMETVTMTGFVAVPVGSDVSTGVGSGGSTAAARAGRTEPYDTGGTPDPATGTGDGYDGGSAGPYTAGHGSAYDPGSGGRYGPGGPAGYPGRSGAVLDDHADVEGLLAHAALWRPDLLLWEGDAPAGAEAAAKAGLVAVCAAGPFDPATTSGAAAVLDTLPPSLRRPEHTERIPVRPVFYGGPAQLPSWLGRKVRRPRILVTGDLSDATVVAVLEAAAGVDAELVCDLGPDAQNRLPAGLRLPAHTRILDTVPVAATLPTCAAVIHDGGAALTAAAVAYGLPQYVTGAAGGTRVSSVAERAAGVGAALPPGTPDALRALLAADGPRDRARALAAETAAMPSPRETVPVLERLVAAAG
ncbi:nucleotide disphospho-sugar-binding domain-containing protein [Streptomyces sp. NPDC006798]|uniref:nucleotide disphospho-sugar-binding domain-containing protein n=1 Tax=Streptomyces sp. NPDC006798 TaxID=3155462 RepID=UPI0033F6787E